MEQRMKAIVFENPGAEDVLVLGDAEAPTAGPLDLLIRVRATAVNRADLLQRQGLYPPPRGASPLLGLECAGEVVAVGSEVAGWKVGDRAMALLAGGGYAEMVAVHHGSALHVPEGLTWHEAGSLPEVFLTAFLNVFELGAAPDRGAVLVHGGGSGVGTAAIQLCREAGIRCIVTAGSEEKMQRCRELGASATINYKDGEFAPRVLEATANRGVDVVLDCVGGRYLAQNIDCLALDGRLVVIGLIGGAKAEINLAKLLMRRLQVIGSTLRTRSAEQKQQLVAAFAARFGAALEAGRIKPVIEKVFPLAAAADAHRLMQSSEHFGKIVLEV
jgi:putative PIG3 family NAD(P)H quinone oxidoreductase